MRAHYLYTEATEMSKSYTPIKMDKRKPTDEQKCQYRKYDSDSLTSAYIAIRKDGMSVSKAAKVYGVPYSTLQDRTRGNVSVDVVRSGPAPLFTQEQEVVLTNHMKTMAEVGFGHSRQETMNLATEYAVHVGLRASDHKPLTDQWLYNFLDRWPELKVKKPRALDVARAKSATRQAVDNCFYQLQHILVKYNLVGKPHLIYNIDEKALNPEHKPPKIVAGKLNKTMAVTSGRNKIVTLIGCVNAVGQVIPPFFVFPGARMLENLLDGACPGVAGAVTYTGGQILWFLSNTCRNIFFLTYLTGMIAMF